ncbi:MAG TPA: hypothetical protein VGD56_10445 [Gemmatirosa sp.]
MPNARTAERNVVDARAAAVRRATIASGEALPAAVAAASRVFATATARVRYVTMSIDP